MQGDRESCLEAGMDDFLGKPIRIDDLAQAVRRWCRGAATSDPEERKAA
jgi:CheY-like chemotaxis protein